MFSLRVRGGKACAAELKTREFKKLLFKSKKANKVTSTSARFNPKGLICNATTNRTIFSLKNTVILPK